MSSSATFRTTIVNVNAGISIAGADSVRVTGTNIGLNADGLPATQGGNATTGGDIGIRVERDGAEIPNNIQVGNGLTVGEVATAACDGPCNAIGRMEVGIDLSSMNGAPDLVSVWSTYIGLGADGTTLASTPDAVGIEVGATGTLNVGDATAAHRTVIAGGDWGVRKANATGSLNLSESIIGFDATGATPLATDLGGVSSIAAFTGVNQTRIGTDGTPIYLTGDDVSASGNILGIGASGTPAQSELGIVVTGDNAQVGQSGNGNRICSVVDGPAISLVGSDDSRVEGNVLGIDEQGTACGAVGDRQNSIGIVLRTNVADDTDGTIVGGTGPNAANVISNTSSNAIVVATAGQNATAHNTGADNGALMLDIGINVGNANLGDGPGNPGGSNGGELIPIVTTATQRVISGTSTPNQRVFVRATSSVAGAAPNGVQALLGATTTGLDGKWKLEFPDTKLASGTRITAIGVDEFAGNMNSEFSSVVAVADVDEVAPVARITSGFTAKSKSRTVIASFDASGETGTTFTCSLDGGAFASCTSPYTSPTLADGSHTLSVRSTDAAGNVSATVTTSTLVDATAPTLRVIGATLTLTKGGTILVKVKCPKGEASGPCTGKVTLTSTKKLTVGKKTKLVVFGTAKVKAASGATVTLKVKPAAANATLIRALKRLGVTASLRGSDALGNTRTATQRLTLVTPTPSKKD